ncbi:GGDEF domain-containing protein [Pseudoalteromonas sp. DL2-H2.2]|uniref:GGDEF domain-containing protein n=1 Tax=Pseudoalteromonas sp. DL2-H2.2 TaxID=2908889 RepID=UPI001F1FE927|nr:GGDEF domain-containing protein [Pseudoalteromonas sp. DL2-H2.2]MCF2909355.1 GGDEF domain-containing protein [Pseudoalteromonas sp. DL2-H2.2]
MVKIFKYTCDYIIHIGCYENTHDVHKVEVTNAFALLSFLIVSIEAVILEAHNHLSVYYLSLPLLLICIFSVVLQYKKYYYLARMILFTSVVIYIFLQAYMIVGKDAGVQNTFFILLTMPWLLFEQNRKSTKVLLSLLCCLCYLFIQYHSSNHPAVILEPSHREMLRFLSDFFAMTVLICLAITFDKGRYHFEKKLKQLATVDPLTGLSNRAELASRGNRALLEAIQNNTPLCVVLLDLDHFKQINDNYGHAFGDLTLKKVAEILSSGLRESDVVARYGGEEFALILPGIGMKDAKGKLENLRMKIQDEQICDKGICINCSASFGVTILSGMMQSITDLFNQADHALYQAKKLGRNRVCEYTENS